MFRSLALFAPAVALRAPAINNVAPNTLREWLSEDKCFNLALTPQYNNQHSVWGLLQSLKDEGLLKNLKGISACSGGSLPGAFLAADRDFNFFSKHFPENGWLGFGPSEPKITNDYARFMNVSLPKRFEQLKVPFALSVTVWDTDKNIFTSPLAAHPMVVSK